MNQMAIILMSFIGFTSLVALITFFKTKESNLDTVDGYFLGGRSLRGGVIAGSLLLTNLAASNFIGMSAQAYDYNMCVMGWEVGAGITLVIVALFLVPKYLKQGITTIPDFLESRFDKGTKNIVTILFLALYIVNMLPVTLYSGAVALSQIFHIETIFHVDYAHAIWGMVWIIGIIGACYAVFGGLKAVAISDTINGIGLIVGGLLVPIFGLIALGKGNAGAGFQRFLTSTPEKFNSIGSNSDPLPFSATLTGLVLVNLYYWGTDQSVIQRALGAENLKEGQKGVMLAGVYKVFTPFILIIPGIMAFQLLGGGIKNSDLVYPIFVNKVLPAPLIGLVAAAMMGAILSTFNSVLNSASTLFAMNVYKPRWGKGKSDAQLVKAGKIFAIVLAFASMFCAPFIMNAPTGLYDYLQKVNGLFNVPIFTVIFIGYLTKRVPPLAAKIVLPFFIITYGLTQTVWHTGLHYLHVSAILFVISCLIMVIIGKIHPMDHDFTLKSCGLVDIHPWKYRFRMAGFVIWLMNNMYIVFSKLGLAKTGGLDGGTALAVCINTAFCLVLSLLLEKKFVKATDE
jgi:SSS family solute:Na+ symporter